MRLGSRGMGLAIAFALIALLGLVAIMVHQRRPRVWDLSASHRISQVPWPVALQDEKIESAIAELSREGGGDRDPEGLAQASAN